MSPELILASYSCARRDSSVRLTNAGSDSLRMPTLATFAVGTRSVILSFMKLITNSSSLAPAISCSSMARIWPTPCAGYTTNSLVLKPWRWVKTFFGSSTRGATATGLLATTGLTATFATVFGAVLAGATFEAVGFEPVAFAAVFAVLFGIALLLFLEDLAAEALDAFRLSLTEDRARLLVAPRLAAAAPLGLLEALFLRVFCDTACARNCHAPVRCFHGTHRDHERWHCRVRLAIAQYSTFSVKINDLWPIRGAARPFSAVSPGLGLRSTTGEDRNRRQLAGRNLSVKSVTGTWSRRKILLEFAFHPLVLLGVGRGFLLLGDVRPALGIFGIHLEPFFQSGLGVGLDGIRGTFRLAHTAVDAFVRMDDQHVVAFVETVHGADLDAIGIFAFDAGFSDDVSHPRLRNGSICVVCVAQELRSRK